MKAITQQQVDKLFEALRKSGLDPIAADYILVVGSSAAIWLEAVVPVQVVIDGRAPSDSVYLVRRDDYERYRPELLEAAS